MNKTPGKVIGAMAILTLATATTNAIACGETLFHSGEGMRYHSFISREPANVLIYRPGMANDNLAQKQLDTGLEKAGHRVTLVTDNTALTQAIAKNRYDVIIAGAHDMDVVAAQLDSSALAPVLVAVMSAKADQDAATSGQYTHTLNDQDGLNQYLRLIEKTMQTRRT